MPSPDITPKPSDKVEFGQKLAKRKSQEFSAKVARWNSTGGGIVSESPARTVVVVPDAVADDKQEPEKDAIIAIVEPDQEERRSAKDESDMLDHSNSPSPSPSPVVVTTPEKIAVSKRSSREVDLTRKAWVRRKSKTQADKVPLPPRIEPQIDVKHVGTPKKRVISDGHWRRDRVVKVEPEDNTVPVPKPLVIKKSVAHIGLKFPSPVKSLPDTLEPKPLRTRRVRPSRSRSSSRERSKTPDFESSGTKVFLTKRRRSRQLDSRPTSRELRSSTSGYTDTSSQQQKDSTDNTTPLASPVRTRRSSPEPANVVERYLKALSPNEFFDPNRNVPESDAMLHSLRRKSKAKARETSENDDQHVVETMPDPPSSAPPKVFGNRIQGWLATTSDPFDSSTSPGNDRARPGNDTREDRMPLSSLRKENDTDQSLRSPTLKRRGARRTATSPVKNRASRETTPVATSDQSQAVVPFGLESQPRSTSRALPALPKRNSTRSHARADALDAYASDDTHAAPKRLLLTDSVLSHASDGDDPRPTGELKRRLTKHSDLMSVLSVARSDSRAVRPRASVRNRHGAADSTIGDVMNALSADELRYQRELRTLVDGVIPVLLQHVLSQSDIISSTSLLGQKNRDNQTVTKPIVDMGVALERLKTLHKRIPMHSHQDLLFWAASATTIYSDYLTVWRMGFQGIVVNLAPAEASDLKDAPRNAQGELVNSAGERVDVAFLLKRPLVRLKHLAKTFEAIEQISGSATAKDMGIQYNQFVQVAKRRSNEEKARLEDEAAAAIDATRAREVTTLAPIAGVQIDSTRCVRARDFFDLDFRHSNGQQLNCKIELIMRDDAPGSGSAGDFLFCEISTTGRWLLFPPVHSTMISARKGRKDRQLVVMLRGYRKDGREWREVMALDAEDDEAVAEWLSMLPSTPVPRNLAAKSSFDLRLNPLMSGALPEPATSDTSNLPSLREIEVPIGEHWEEASIVWDASEVNSDVGDYVDSFLRRRTATRRRSNPTSTIVEEPYPEIPPTEARQRSNARQQRPQSAYFGDHAARGPISYNDRSRHSWDTAPAKSGHSVWMPPKEEHIDYESDEDDHPALGKRPSLTRRVSSVPSADLPTLPRLRRSTQSGTAARDVNHLTPSRPQAYNEPEDPNSAPAKLQRRKSTPPESADTPQQATPPSNKARPTSSGFRNSIIPSLTPAFMKRHRRSSSPLKHEYEPSTDSSSDSEVSAVDKDESFTSHSTVEILEDEQISTIGELKSFPTFGGYKPMRQATPPESLYAPSDPSLAPSQSASQAPYRTVPVQELKARETTASIFVWADSGSWESLHPEECCVIVTPGLIEAFDNAQAHAAPAEDAEQAMQSPSARGVKPLVALEMTPLVPLRRGTALDISIRSPPTANSLYRTGNNIMFRSRNAEQCEALYHMLNRARIDNPTYLALQRARGPTPQSNWGELMEQRANARASGSWWTLGSRKSSTYRSKALSRPQSIAVTESSVGTLNTAFSALRRFSGSNRIFNIAKSTITSRQGSRSTYSDSLDSGIASTAMLDPKLGTPLGLTNMKIRLYLRETASKWRDMGAARLTILIPPRPDPSIPASPAQTGREKRVLITGKTKGEILLDKTLGESCFERIARTGIAVSVWEENVDGLVATTGGVLAAKTRVYMIQMKSDREAAYTFGLVGKLRY